jgi:excisionase family DNA binding protein
VTKPPSMTIEEVANKMSAAAARVATGLREVSSAIAEFREAETVLKGLVAESPMIVEANRKSENDRHSRLAYTVPELAWKLGVHRRTIERRIGDGTLKSTNVLGHRLVTAESVRAMFEAGRDADAESRMAIRRDCG